MTFMSKNAVQILHVAAEEGSDFIFIGVRGRNSDWLQFRSHSRCPVGRAIALK